LWAGDVGLGNGTGEAEKHGAGRQFSQSVNPLFVHFFGFPFFTIG
jgi:hypothetical protein